MPIVDVTYDPRISEDVLQRIADILPHAVSVAVECPEEPYDGSLQPGDVDLRFRPRGPLDSGGLDLVVEVRSKWFASRAESLQQRCDGLRAALAEVAGPVGLGVYVCLPVAGWAQ